MLRRMLSCILVLRMVFSLMIVSLPTPVKAAELDDDWAEIQSVLANCVGTYSGVNNNIPTAGLADGPLMGNGHVGVAVAGDNTWARLYISTTDFWTGWHGRSLPLPIGAVNLTVIGSSGSGVTQKQDMQHAQVSTSLTNGRVEMRSWVSATSDFVVSEVWTTGTSPVTMTIETWARNDNSGYPCSTGVDANGICWAARVTQTGSGVDWVARGALATKVIGATCSTYNNGSNTATQQFTLSSGTTVKVVTAVKTVKDATNHITGACSSANSQTAASINTMKTNHLAWWKNYWLKSFVRTYDSQLEKYYFGALYEAGSSYREGYQVGGLFGPWVTSDGPKWGGNMTLSYNHQASVVGFASSNRPELLKPYIQNQLDWEARGRALAAQTGPNSFFNVTTANMWGTKWNNGIPGIMESVGTTPWGGDVFKYNAMSMVSPAVWASTPIIWYINATQDLSYLSANNYRVYNNMKGITDFWENYLVKENGKWVVKYAGAREWYARTNINSIFDNALVKNFFKNMIIYAQGLGVDSGKISLWQDIVNNMKPFPTGIHAANGKTVFFEYDGGDYPDDWPGLAMIAGHANAINLSSSAADKTLFKDSIDSYNGWNHICAAGFIYDSCVKAGYPAASLLSRFQSLLSTSMRRNFTVPTGGHGVESISSLGYINGCMLQGFDGILRFFPQWPNANAKFRRLRAEGAFVCSATLTNGVAGNVTINSEKGKTCKVLNPWAGSTLVVKDGTSTLSTTISGDIYTFNTVAGHTYALSSSGGSDRGGLAVYMKQRMRQLQMERILITVMPDILEQDLLQDTITTLTQIQVSM